MLDSLEVRIIFHKQGNNFTAVTEQRNGQSICANTFQYNPSELMLLDAPSSPTVPQPASWLVRKITQRQPRNPLEMQAAHYGAQLYQYVFGTGRKFREFLRARRDSVIRLVLIFPPEVTLLNRLPWEYLHDGKDFLLKHNIHLIRQSDKQAQNVPVASAAPLRILALIAKPALPTSLDAEQALAELHAAFGPLIAEGAATIDVLPEVTTFALRRALNNDYHAVFFAGNSEYNAVQHCSYLYFEDDKGDVLPLTADIFSDILKGNPPHLVVLQGQPVKQSGIHDPCQHFALSCLSQGVPGVVNIPPGLHPDAALKIIRTLFSTLSAGQSVAESMGAVRERLMSAEDASNQLLRCDWGLPNAFVGCERLQLVAPVDDSDRLNRASVGKRGPYPILVDRSKELQHLRKALRDSASVIYLWGQSGAGKSALIDELLSHTGEYFEGVLRVQCDEIHEPLSVLSKLANFWAGHTPIEHKQAANVLLDSRQDPFIRAQTAQHRLRKYRYLVIFENIDTWFKDSLSETALEGEGTMSDPLLRSILLGLLHAQSGTTYLFSGKRQWSDLSVLPNAQRRKIPLPLLNAHWATQFMLTLPGLAPASDATKQAVFWHIGGHPLALKLLAAWSLVNEANNVENLMQAPPVTNRSTQHWIAYVLDEIIDNLDPGQSQVLPMVAVLNRPFTEKVLPKLTPVSAPYAGDLLRTWRKLELIQEVGYGGNYKFHALMRDYILSRLSEEEMKELHSQAAAYYGAPFVDEARRQIFTRNIGNQSEERITWLARDTNGILGAWLRQGQQSERYQELLDLAMSWQYHLYLAGEYQAAVQVARAIVPVLHDLGLRDLSGALLQRAMSAAEGHARTLSMDGLANLKVADGHLAGAVTLYDEVYKALLSHGTDSQRAYILTRSAQVLQELGLLEDAMYRYQKALKILRQVGEKDNQVVCLHHMAVVYKKLNNLQQALVYSQAAKELYEKLVDDRGLASVSYEQGCIMKALNHLDGALENFANSTRLCRKLGDLHCIADNLFEIGDVLQKLDRTEMAIRALEEAAGYYKKLSAPESDKVMQLLEDLYGRQKRLTDAVQRFKTAKQKAVRK